MQDAHVGQQVGRGQQLEGVARQLPVGRQRVVPGGDLGGVGRILDVFKKGGRQRRAADSAVAHQRGDDVSLQPDHGSNSSGFVARMSLAVHTRPCCTYCIERGPSSPR